MWFTPTFVCLCLSGLAGWIINLSGSSNSWWQILPPYFTSERMSAPCRSFCLIILKWTVSGFRSHKSPSFPVIESYQCCWGPAFCFSPNRLHFNNWKTGFFLNFSVQLDMIQSFQVSEWKKQTQLKHLFTLNLYINLFILNGYFHCKLI